MIAEISGRPDWSLARILFCSADIAELRNLAQRVADSCSVQAQRTGLRRVMEHKDRWLPAYAATGRLPSIEGLAWPTGVSYGTSLARTARRLMC